MSQIVERNPDLTVDAASVDEGSAVGTEERRVELVRRLLERGVPVRALEALLPGWEQEIAVAAFEG